MGDPFDDDDGPRWDEDPTAVDDVDLVEVELEADAVTKPHDQREWLNGFEAGRRGGMMDVLQALIAVQREDGAPLFRAKAYAERVRRKIVG